MSQYTGSSISIDWRSGIARPRGSSREAAESGAAADAGRQVAGTAAEQAAQVAQEAKDQARPRRRGTDGCRTRRASDSRRPRMGSARWVASCARWPTAGSSPASPRRSHVRRPTRSTASRAGWGSEPGDLVEEVRSFARRRPGVFLLGAAVAGTVVGRLTRRRRPRTDPADRSAPTTDRAIRPPSPAARHPRRRTTRC